MEDRQVLDRINALMDEEHRLLNTHTSGKAMSEEERQRMEQLDRSAVAAAGSPGAPTASTASFS